MAGLSIPTGAQLPSHLRVDCSNDAVQKTLGRLSRSSLLTLAIAWTRASPSSLSAPSLLRDHLRERRGLDLNSNDDDDEDDDYEREFEDEAFVPARSLRHLQKIYEKWEGRKGSKSEVLGRITECDWKPGITLYQLAMADFQYLTECPSALKWATYRLVPLKMQSEDAGLDDEAKIDDESLTLPSFHPPSFLERLQAQVLPDVRAHYCFDRHGSLPLMLLRIFIIDSPYNTGLALQAEKGAARNFDSSRTIYVAFPDSSPYIYISKAHTKVKFQAGDAKSLHNLIFEGIPKAMSRSRERFTLEQTHLSTRNLNELVERNGPNRTNKAGGGWSFYADKTRHISPLVMMLPASLLADGRCDSLKPPVPAPGKRELSQVSHRDERIAKRAKLLAKARFEGSGYVRDRKGVERVDIAMHDAYPDIAESQTSQGDDVLDIGEQAGCGPSIQRPSSNRGRHSDIDAVLERGREAIDEEEEDDELEGTWRPEVRITFHGSHVFAGVRQLVEHGIIDGERMPGWLTGQEGVTVGSVRHGRIEGNKR